MINLADTHAFLAIVHSGGITAAARQLKVPKSTLTRQLTRLERELCCELIARTTRSSMLTEKGKEFLPYAERLIDDSVEIENRLRRSPQGASGHLTISAPWTFGRMFLVPSVIGFRKLHPKIRIDLRLTSTKVQLAREQIDIAFRLGPLLDPELGSRRLGAIKFGLFAAPSYMAKRPLPETPDDLNCCDLIELRPPSTKHHMDLFCGQRSFSVRYIPVLSADDPEAVKAMCLSGGGIAALPLFLTAVDVSLGSLTRILPEWEPAAADLYVIFRSCSVLPLRVRTYLDFIFETIGRSRPWEVPNVLSC